MKDSMTKKVRLLGIAFNDLGHGGIQTQFMDVTKRLQDQISTDLIVWSDKPAYYDEEFRKYGRIFVCHHYEGSNPILRKLDYFTRYFRIKRDVYRIIKENGPYDAVHCHKFFECAPCLAAAKKAGVPIRIAHSHNTAMKPKHRTFVYWIKQLYNAVYRRIIRKNATAMIGCSQQAADYLFGPGYGHPVYNAVDLNRFNPERYPEQKHHGLRLIHVGNFNEQKNQLFLVEIFAELVKLCPDSHLSMIGQDSLYCQEVRKKIESLGLNERISILPHDSDIPLELSRSDCFVFPSSFEGFGNVLIEAQAMGLTSFVSTEITKEADCGLLTFIPLEEGAKKWASVIASQYRETGFAKQYVDMSRFAPENNSAAFLNLYRGTDHSQGNREKS